MDSDAGALAAMMRMPTLSVSKVMHLRVLLSTVWLISLPVASAYGQAEVALLLFGGRNHDTYLGCLNCGKYQTGSICNKYGDFGSKYSQKSVWNKYADSGSRYSNDSPWNRFATNPPVIVDDEGNFYGYLTANRHHPKRTTIKLYVALADLWEEIIDDPEKVSDAFCGR